MALVWTLHAAHRLTPAKVTVHFAGVGLLVAEHQLFVPQTQQHPPELSSSSAPLLALLSPPLVWSLIADVANAASPQQAFAQNPLMTTTGLPASSSMEVRYPWNSFWFVFSVLVSQ